VYWRVAPMVCVLLALVKVVRAIRSPYERYDLFLSYKSEDSLLARHIAEQLIARRVKVWFNEYELLIDEQLELLNAPPGVAETMINDAIVRGARGASYALVITNDLYTTSPYCKTEIETILATLTPSHVLEVMAPRQAGPHALFPALSRCHRIDAHEGVGAIVDRALEMLARTGPPGEGLAPPQPDDLFHGECLGRPYTLNIAGWTVADPGGVLLQPNEWRGPELHTTMGGVPFAMNLIFGQETDRPVVGRRAGVHPDERWVFNYLIGHARRHLTRLGGEPRGLHLLFHGGFSQFAITYRLRGLWMRKYSIIVRSPSSEQVAELVFTFGSPTPSLKEFCRNAYRMDELLLSLRWT
jgi:hypothetical protein